MMCLRRGQRFAGLDRFDGYEKRGEAKSVFAEPPPYLTKDVGVDTAKNKRWAPHDVTSN